VEKRNDDVPAITRARDLVKVSSSATGETLPMETKVKAVEAGIDVAKDLCSMLIFAANVHAEGAQLRQRSEAAWDSTRQRISVIDAESGAEIAKLSKALEETQERTRQIQVITECISKVTALPNASEEICKGLRAALENLTQRG
jgi:hypothetical protein